MLPRDATALVNIVGVNIDLKMSNNTLRRFKKLCLREIANILNFELLRCVRMG